MLLREGLKESTKENLMNIARNFELKNCSRLKKGELIDRIVDFFTAEDVLRNRLSCLTKEQMILFRKACDKPQKISADEIVDGIELYRYFLGNFQDSDDRFTVFEEITDTFRKIDDDKLKQEQAKKSWIMKCIRFFADYYEIAPLEIMYDLYKLKIKGSIDEMTAVLKEIPVDITESAVFTPAQLGMQNLSKEDPLYSERGFYVHLSIFEDNGLRKLLNQQLNKQFYIPSVHQLEEIRKNGYEADSLAYKDLMSFFTKKMNISYEMADAWCMKVWSAGYEGKMPSVLMNEMQAEGLLFQNDDQVGEFLRYLMNAFNNTRMKENRGNKPWELRQKSIAGDNPVMAGKTAGTKENKKTERIYPNDPCPCGSGKKYKKCCGKA